MKVLRSSFWLHSLFYTLLQRFSLLFFGTFAYIVLVRTISPEQNGVWVLYLVILGIFESVKQGLLRNPTIKFLGMPDHELKKDVVYSASLMINVLFSLLAIIVLVFCRHLFASFLQAPELDHLLQWSILSILFLIPFNHYEIILQAAFRFDTIFWAYFVRNGCFLAGVLSLRFISKDQFTLLNLVRLQIVCLFIGCVVFYFATKKYRLKQFIYDAGLTGDMLHFGKFIFGTNLLSNLSRTMDRIVTANALSHSALAKSYVSYYDAVARINTLIDIPSLAAADVLFPKNVEAFENDGVEKVKYYFENMIGIILAIIIPLSVLIFLFPKIIIYFLAGEQYYPAVLILQITIFFSIVRPLAFQFGSTMDAIGKPRVNFLVNLVFLLINIPLTYFCLFEFGPLGAAYAMTIGYSVSFIIMYFVLKFYINISMRNIFIYMLKSYPKIYGMVRIFLQRGSNGS